MDSLEAAVVKEEQEQQLNVLELATSIRPAADAEEEAPWQLELELIVELIAVAASLIVALAFVVLSIIKAVALLRFLHTLELFQEAVVCL